jgi:cytochrome c oxidase cbb3-type subunit 4
MISGIVTAILIIAFLAMVLWAWSDKRKDDFEHLSNLPLEEDKSDSNYNKGEQNGNV